MTRTRIGTVVFAAAVTLGPAAVAFGQPTPPPDEDEAGMPAPPTEPEPAEASGTVGAEAETGVETTVSTPPTATGDEAGPEASSEVGYDKGFFISSKTDKGDFKLKIQARVQSRLEGTSELDAATDERANTSAFQIARARLTLGGHAFTKKLEYKFQSDFGKGFVTLKDFYIDGEVADGIWVRTGQWKRPFSRQQITSSGNLELVDRSITDKEYRAGRDIGVALHNGYEDSPGFEWAIGVFNGPGEKPIVDGDAGTITNVPGDFLPVIVARAGLNSPDLKGYSEGDFEGGPLRWGVAASVWVEGDFDGGDPPEHQAQADFILKNNGLSLSGAAYLATVEDELATIGAHAQAGYVLGEGSRRMNASARYAIIVPQGDGAEDPTHEVTVGVGWFPHKHNVKVQADVGSRIDPAHEGVADEVIGRLQAQLSF